MGGFGFSAAACVAFSFELVAWIERARLMLLCALVMTPRTDHCDNTDIIWLRRLYREGVRCCRAQLGCGKYFRDFDPLTHVIINLPFCLSVCRLKFVFGSSLQVTRTSVRWGFCQALPPSHPPRPDISVAGVVDRPPTRCAGVFIVFIRPSFLSPSFPIT